MRSRAAGSSGKPLLEFGRSYDLYVTAGSDYHGTNKTVILGDTGLTVDTDLPDGMKRFLSDIGCN